MKVFPINALSNGSTYNTDKVKAAKVFPIFGRNSKTMKLFSHLTFVVKGI